MQDRRGNEAGHGSGSTGQLGVLGPAGAAAARSVTAGSVDQGERRLLAAMPLHAITALHGEAGLRERLAIETAGLPEADREQVNRALDLAARLHAADRR